MATLNDDQCRWIIGPASASLCCGKTVTSPRKSYCNAHSQGLNYTDTRWQARAVSIDYTNRPKRGRPGRKTGTNLV